MLKCNYNVGLVVEQPLSFFPFPFFIFFPQLVNINYSYNLFATDRDEKILCSSSGDGEDH